MCWAPLIGGGLGLLAAAALLLARRADAPALGCALALTTLAALTRGLHLDGLADTADGLGSLLPPEQARAVMKRPEVGALGLACVLLTLGVQGTALYACVQHGRGTAGLVLAAVSGRLAVTLACTRGTPAASTTGLGALVAETVPGRRAVLLVAGALAVGASWQALDEHAGWSGSLRALASIAVGLIAARLLLRHTVRRLGGLTGDVLGAIVEVATTVVLVGMALGQ